MLLVLSWLLYESEALLEYPELLTLEAEDDELPLETVELPDTAEPWLGLR